MASEYPIIVAQYDLPGHPRRTEHWSLVILRDLDHAYMFDLMGNRSNFQYVASSSDRFSRSQQLRGGCLVGSVLETQLEWLKARLKNVEIIYNDLNFDCQDWVLSALRMLRQDGMRITTASEINIRAELAREKIRWVEGDDTIEDRLFSQ